MSNDTFKSVSTFRAPRLRPLKQTFLPNALDSSESVTPARRFIVVTGSPGVGKTAFAKKLGDLLKCPVISVGKLALEERLVVGHDKSRRTMIADLKRLSARLKKPPREKGSNRAIVEGHYAHLVVDREDLAMAFVLRCQPAVLGRRLSSRGWRKKKIVENKEAELIGVCSEETYHKFKRSHIVEVDMTMRKPATAAKFAKRFLDGRKTPPMRIDWLRRGASCR